MNYENNEIMDGFYTHLRDLGEQFQILKNYCFTQARKMLLANYNELEILSATVRIIFLCF